MDLQAFLNSREGGILAYSISRLLPPPIGFRLADFIAEKITANRQLPMVRGIRTNQWMISQKELSGRELNQAVLDTFRHLTRSFYLLFHYIKKPKQLRRLITFGPDVERVIQGSQQKKSGLLVVGAHMSYFDVALQAASYHGLRAIGLSLPQSNQAVEWQHQFRRQSGVEILPATLGNLRQVIERLKAGETVVTGADRPMPKVKFRPLFFGEPAHLPIHHIQLALNANVPLIVMVVIKENGGEYRIYASDYLHLQKFPDRKKEILFNAELVLDELAKFIHRAPHQWTVFQPVWPEWIEKVP